MGVYRDKFLHEVTGSVCVCVCVWSRDSNISMVADMLLLF